MSSQASNGVRRAGVASRLAPASQQANGIKDGAAGESAAPNAAPLNGANGSQLAAGENAAAGGGGGGGRAAEEAGSSRGKKRSRTGPSGSTSEKENEGAAEPKKWVHPNQESSDRWFTNTHIAMVRILGGVFDNMQERHLAEVGQDPETDEVIVAFMKRVTEIGQGVTAMTVSRLQTHSLISNTVQLCHRMAADQRCRLDKNYPTGVQSEHDVFDYSTDDPADGSASESNGDDDDDEDWSPETGGGQRSRKNMAPTSSFGGGAGAGAGANGGALFNGGVSRGVSNGKGKKKRRGTGGGTGGRSVRERFETVVGRLVTRAKWSSEAAGRPRKDVITRAREMVMAIFVDSYYRRTLSLHRLDVALQQLEGMINWADRAKDSDSAKEFLTEKKLSLSEIGLANITLTAPE